MGADDEVHDGLIEERRSRLTAVRPLEVVEREYILAALALNRGNQTRTAEQLQIGTATLYRKLKSYGFVRGKPALTLRGV